MCVVTRLFTPMRSDLGQRGDCYWAFATAVYSRTSERSGMRHLWYSLGGWVGAKWWWPLQPPQRRLAPPQCLAPPQL